MPENIAPIADLYAQKIREIYAESELRILEKLAKRIANGIDTDSNDWVVKKLAELKHFNTEIGNEIKSIKSTPVIEQAIKASYDAGEKWAVNDLKRANLTDISASNNGGKNERLRALVKKTVNPVEKTHTILLRQSQDIYRKVISETQAQVLTGTLTRRQAAQVALDKFAAKGITGFIDKAKRHWEISSYCEMSVRAGVTQSSVEGHLDKLKENGKDLVIISVSPESCPICNEFEGQIFSISGDSDKYPPLDDAISEGLFHPGCTHRTLAYIEGLTEQEKVEKHPEDYKEKQQQRMHERNIRQWKRKEALALDDSAKAKARNGLNASKDRMKDFIEETGRKRDYGRESITKAR